MRIFVTGANGFIGSAIVRELLAAGHQVLGLVRSDAAASALAATGAGVHRGVLEDPDDLARAAATCDGVAHTAFIHDFKDLAAAGATDERAIAAMAAALAGSHKPLVITSGLVVTPGRLATEDSVVDPGTAGSHRLPSERTALAAAERGVRAQVIRLPPSVHGDGDHGFVPMLIDIARRTRVAGYVADGTNRWPAVHRLDVAHLFRLALERGTAGAIFHGVADEGVPTRALAEVIGRRLGVPVASIPREAAVDHFGFLGRFFGADCPASSALTRERLGWQPRGPGLLEDVDHPRYFTPAASA